MATAKIKGVGWDDIACCRTGRYYHVKERLYRCDGCGEHRTLYDGGSRYERAQYRQQFGLTPNFGKKYLKADAPKNHMHYSPWWRR